MLDVRSTASVAADQDLAALSKRCHQECSGSDDVIEVLDLDAADNVRGLAQIAAGSLKWPPCSDPSRVFPIRSAVRPAASTTSLTMWSARPSRSTVTRSSAPFPEHQESRRADRAPEADVAGIVAHDECLGEVEPEAPSGRLRLDVDVQPGVRSDASDRRLREIHDAVELRGFVQSYSTSWPRSRERTTIRRSARGVAVTGPKWSIVVESTAPPCISYQSGKSVPRRRN